jgi:hypothetical protein
VNIFALSECPEQSALWLDDIRKNKMILESAQMLSTAIRLISGTHFKVRSNSGKTMVSHWVLPEDDWELAIYKTNHINHPCAIWARQSRANFRWLLDHMRHLYIQKIGPHKSAELIKWFEKYADTGKFPSEDLTPFENCARNEERGVDYSDVCDVHEAYRLYMNDRWKERNITLTWRWGEEPEWRN